MVKCLRRASSPSDPHLSKAAKTHRAFADSVAQGASASKAAHAKKMASRGPNSYRRSPSRFRTTPIPMGSSAAHCSARSTSSSSDGDAEAKLEERIFRGSCRRGGGSVPDGPSTAPLAENAASAGTTPHGTEADSYRSGSPSSGPHIGTGGPNVNGEEACSRTAAARSRHSARYAATAANVVPSLPSRAAPLQS